PLPSSRSQLIPRPPTSPLFPYTTLFRSGAYVEDNNIKIITPNSQFIMPTSSLALEGKHNTKNAMAASTVAQLLRIRKETIRASIDRKSTRLNSSHVKISYAVFCLKKKIC